MGNDHAQDPRYAWGLADEIMEKFLLGVGRLLHEDYSLPRAEYMKGHPDSGWPALFVQLPGDVRVTIMDGRDGGHPAGTVTVWDSRTKTEKRFSLVDGDPGMAELFVADYVAELETEGGARA